tara:strand:+ start:3130 stop:3471 length:342 start_codon:yes stop_codon:yes gene_type:complete
MKNWKDKVLGIFAGIGVMSLLMATNSQQPNVNYGTPESHVWEMVRQEGSAAVYTINKVTGEVRDINVHQYVNDKGEVYGGFDRKEMRLGKITPLTEIGGYRVIKPEIEYKTQR